jgi:hypothetical protein
VNVYRILQTVVFVWCLFIRTPRRLFDAGIQGMHDQVSSRNPTTPTDRAKTSLSTEITVINSGSNMNSKVNKQIIDGVVQWKGSWYDLTDLLQSASLACGMHGSHSMEKSSPVKA